MNESHLTLGRRTLLRGAIGGALVGGGALLGASSGTAAYASGYARNAPVSPGIGVRKIKNLTGPGLTDQYGVMGTDLGIPVELPSGRVLWIFGDTFPTKATGAPEGWLSPVGLYSRTRNLDRGVKWSGSVVDENGATKQLLPYDHAKGKTKLPTDAIVIDGVIYLHVAVHEPFKTVTRTEIWKSRDDGRTWTRTAAQFDGDYDRGLFQMLSWTLGDDGYVYIVSTKFSRTDGFVWRRVLASKIEDPTAYESWRYIDRQWTWVHGTSAKPTMPMTGPYGELCFRRMAGKWVLTWFNEGNYCIDGMILDSPTDIRPERRRTLISGGSWGADNESVKETEPAQLYGGYIIPGSTLDNLHLSVSQWYVKKSWPYRTMQFKVTGFGS